MKAASMACVLLVTLASCATKARPKAAPAPEPIRFNTLEKVQAGALSEKDMEVLSVFLRRACSTKKTSGTIIAGSRREEIGLTLREYPKPTSGLACFRLYIASGSILGVVYSIPTDRLYLVDLDHLDNHTPLVLKRTPEGYFFTLIHGCCHYPLKVATTNGQPYVIKIVESGESPE